MPERIAAAIAIGAGIRQFSDTHAVEDDDDGAFRKAHYASHGEADDAGPPLDARDTQAKDGMTQECEGQTRMRVSGRPVKTANVNSYAPRVVAARANARRSQSSPEPRRDRRTILV